MCDWSLVSLPDRPRNAPVNIGKRDKNESLTEQNRPQPDQATAQLIRPNNTPYRGLGQTGLQQS